MALSLITKKILLDRCDDVVSAGGDGFSWHDGLGFHDSACLEVVLRVV